jgi:hypothetical protein
MKKSSLQLLRPMILVFILVNAFLIAGKTMLAKWEADQAVLIGGHLLVFGMVFISFLLLQRSLASNNAQAFVRAMYGSFIIKFFVLAIAAFVYIQVTKKLVNKPALFACMGFYLVYTFLEINALMKLLKQKKNA